MAAGARLSGHVERMLRALPWLLIISGLIVERFIADAEAGRNKHLMLALWTLAFFVVLAARLLLAMSKNPGRRGVLIPLFAGLTLWFTASAILSGSEAVSMVSFPSREEWLFLAAYVAWAAFVILDARNRPSLRSAVAWTDAVIICGTAAAVVSTFVVTPLTLAYPEGGFALFVALIYPALDALLALIVIGQWALRLRRDRLRTALLVAGFLCVAVADTSLGVGVSTSAYQYTSIAEVMWGVGFALIVEAAVRRPNPRSGGSFMGASAGVIAVAFAISLLILVLRPSGPVGIAIVGSAAVVLAAAGVRLLLTLREANRVNDALKEETLDHITGLPSRRALVLRIEEAIGAGRRFGFLLADVDRFTELNDALGHETGDYILRVVAGRIAEVTPAGSVLGRLGGDAFGMVVNTNDLIVLGQLAEAVRSSVAVPIGVDGLAVSVHVCVGVTAGAIGDVLASDVFRRADIAHQEAVQGSGVAVYQNSKPPTHRADLELAADLRRAVRHGDLGVCYLPIARAGSGEVVSVEALVRWEHPRLGQIPPMRFLPVARREGLMQQVTDLVIDRVVADLALWRQSGLGVGAAINLSSGEVFDQTLAHRITGRLEDGGIDTRRITLEVTEDVYRRDPELSRRVILEMHQLGLRTSVDHFGTGFSSLSSLRDLPVDEVKLDRSFFASVMSDPRSAVIVQNAIAMAHALGMSVVAEGVESDAVAARATVLGVDLLQGFYLTRPLSADHVPAFVRSLEVGGFPRKQ